MVRIALWLSVSVSVSVSMVASVACGSSADKAGADLGSAPAKAAVPPVAAAPAIDAAATAPTERSGIIPASLDHRPAGYSPPGLYGTSARTRAQPAADAALDAATTARCEALRTKFLAWETELVKTGVATRAPEDRARVQEKGDEELRWATRSFVVACAAMGDALDGSCFASDLPKDRRRACSHMNDDLRNRISDEQKLGRGER